MPPITGGGTTVASEIAAGITGTGSVDFTPFLATGDTDPGTIGFQAALIQHCMSMMADRKSVLPGEFRKLSMQWKSAAR